MKQFNHNILGKRQMYYSTVDISAPKKDILTPEEEKKKEVAQYLRKSLSWVYKNWRILGGRKLRGSLFFPKKEELYEFLFYKREGMEVRIHPEGKRYTRAWFKTRREAMKAETERREDVMNPKPTKKRG